MGNILKNYSILSNAQESTVHTVTHLVAVRYVVGTFISDWKESDSGLEYRYQAKNSEYVRVVHRVGLGGLNLQSNRNSIGRFPFQRHRCRRDRAINESPSASDFASLFGMDRPSSPSSLRQFATVRLRLHGSVLD
jgi:hypothetical protein